MNICHFSSPISRSVNIFINGSIPSTTTTTITLFLYISMKCKDRENKVYYMSLEIEVTKGFLVKLQLLCIYGDLREKSY